MLLTRRAIETVGLFDESYFFSFEDLDWCLRARRAGFASVVAPDARVYHQGSASMGDSPERLYYAARNHLKVAGSLNGGGGLRGAVRTASVISLNLAHAVRAGGGTIGARVGAVARGVRDQLRS
jgi:GT2 family glycosyltransferase